MADTTKLTIELQLLLRNLNRTLRGLDQVKKRLEQVAAIKVQPQTSTRRAADLQRFAEQHRRIVERTTKSTQGLAQAQERSRQATERLSRAQDIFGNTIKNTSRQMDAHVRVFRAQQQAMQSFNRTLTSFGNSLRSVGQGLASFGATLTFAVSAPLAALTVNVVDAAVRMDSLRRGLTTIAGSSQEAAVQLERLTEIAKLPGIGFEEAIQGSIALQAVGFSAAEAEKSLVQFSNAVALTGGSREQLQTITVQLGQMAAQSKVLAADLKPIINAAPAVAVALRNAFGTVRSEEIQELGIQSKDFIDIMVRELAKLPRATAGARNSFDNFRDTIFRASAAIGESLLPALVSLAETVGPIVTALANAFKALPVPLQSTLLVVGALVIALGPLSFIFGQLITGLGRVVVGFAQLNALGLLPTIANFRLLGRVMIGTASLAQGAAATAAAAAVGWAALAGAIVAVVGLAAAIIAFSRRTEEQVETTEQQVRATDASLKILRAQREVLKQVTDETEAAANASDELKTIYKSLNKESQGRVTAMQREVGLTRALRQEIARLIGIRAGEQRIQAATTAASITETAQQVETLGKQIDSTINRIDRLTKARKELLATGRTTQIDPLLSNIASLDTTKQVEQIDRKLKELAADTLADLRKKSDEAVESLSKQNDILLQLEASTGKSTRTILEAAKQYGLFKGDVDNAVLGIENFRQAQIALQAALSGATEEVIKQRLEMRKLTAPADEAQKQRQRDIQAAIDFARENSNSIEEAKQKLKEFQDQFPEVRKSIETELQKKPIEDFLQEALGQRKRGGGRDTGTSLRNAQQQLADAITQIALAQGEREVAIEQDKNERLLQSAEVGQRLRLVSYREFLELRAKLTGDDLDREITQQQKVVAAARATQSRLLDEARRAGIPQAERIRRQAQAAQAEEEAIRAETQLIVLQRQRDRINEELQQSIREAQQQQIADIAQLEIRYAELQGRIEDALKAATVEEFREALETLGRAQKFLNEQIKTATGERKKQLQVERDLNQRQIEGIHRTIRQKDALAQLAAAEKLVENAKERQRELESKLAFEVQFRGLKEEDAIKRRLEGEQKLEAALINAGETIQQIRDNLIALGITPPPQLGKFVEAMNQELRGLAELTFPEQFRLAEKEFSRLNDERLRRIADVERAINNRNISEAEGLLLIRKINGEYVGDLERQLELLKQIAAASGDASLQRQAQSAEETVKDANDRLASFGKQLRSTSIDALRSSFIDFFQSLRDNTISAQEKLLGLIDSVVERINEVIAENIFDELMKSIFGDGTEGGGIIAGLKRFFGFGRDEGKAGIADVTSGAAGKATEATAAATALTTGATAAGTALVTAGTTAGTTLLTAITTAATSFASLVAAAGAAFAASVTAGSVAGSAGGGLSGLLGGFAATGMFPAVPGGVYKIVEGGYPEAVLTTDPKHFSRQLAILRAYIAETRGLGGRVKGFAAGGFMSPAEALSGIGSAPMVLNSGLGDIQVNSGPASFKQRLLLVDKRSVHDWINTPEGESAVVEVIEKNRPLIRRLSGN